MQLIHTQPDVDIYTYIQGFGVTARSTAEARRLDPTGIVCFRQADVGEYLREVSPTHTYTISLSLSLSAFPPRIPWDLRACGG